MFNVHHLLDDCCGINTRKVVVFENWHKRNSTGSHYKMFGIDVEDASVAEILACYAFAFEQVPNCGVEEDVAVVVASKRFCDVETTHSAVNLLLLEEEELVRLHIELTANSFVVIDNYVGNAHFVEFLTASQTSRTSTDDYNLSLVNLACFVLRFDDLREIVLRNFANRLNAIDRSYADTLYFSIDQHLAGTAFADAALEAALASVDAMTVNREARLMQGCCNSITFLSCNLLTIILKGGLFGLWNVQNRMFGNLVHFLCFYNELYFS